MDGDGAPATETWEAADPTAALAEVMARFQPVPVAGLPRFWGGAVGWVGYEVVRAFERLPARAPSAVDGPEIPELCMVLTDTLVIFDNLRQTVKVVACAHVPRPDDADAVYERSTARIEEIIARLHGPAPRLAPLLPPPVGEAGSAALRWGGEKEPRSAFARAEYMAAVERIRSYILAGDIFQVVLSQRLEIEREGLDLFDVYRALRIINPSPYMFHLAYPEAEVTGASPETLVRCADGRVEVRPIAGTRPRGRDGAEDERLAEELAADPKERAEHLMLIDLGRNDIGRVSEIGSVRVSELMAVERYSHVMHLVSHVQAATGARAGLARRAAGRVPGRHAQRRAQDPRHGDHRRARAAPARHLRRRRRLRVVHRQHGSGDRDPHPGGHGRHRLRTGRRGHRADSDPAAEYEETLNKARAVLRAVALARKSRAAHEGAQTQAHQDRDADSHR